VLLAVLFGLELTPPVQDWFVVPWTNTLARISAGLVTLFDSDVLANGKVLRSTSNGFACRSRPAATASRRRSSCSPRCSRSRHRGRARSSGLVAGIAAVQGLNVVRVISLFYLGSGTARCSSGRTCTCGRR
jgi:hypothetical protein